MPESKSLFSALRALSSVPNIQPDELQQFSSSLELGCPLPDGSYVGEPVWRIPEGSVPPRFFQVLVERMRKSSGLVANDGYFGQTLLGYEIIITEPALRCMIHGSSEFEMTDAEFRLATLLLQGLDLREAAIADGTGYETKRSQFKSLAGKLCLNRQSEVVKALTIKSMLGFMHLAQPQSQTDFDKYADTYLPRQVRRLTIVSAKGKSVPVVEYGPVTGSPLVVLHPMFFPPIGNKEISQAEELGVRLVWPLRPGLLNQEAPVLSSSMHLAESTNGLIAVLEQLVGCAAPVLAFVSSGAIATRAAQARPDLVKSISFIATCYSAGRTNISLPYFGAELAELALRSEMVMTRTVAALQKYVSSQHRFRGMFESVFQAGDRDLEHIKKEFDGKTGGQRLRSVILKSPESIKHDFFNHTQFRWQELSSLSVRRRFLHGAKDSIHPPDRLCGILKRLGEEKPIIDQKMGHLPHFSDLRSSVDFAVSWQIHSA